MMTVTNVLSKQQLGISKSGINLTAKGKLIFDYKWDEVKMEGEKNIQIKTKDKVYSLKSDQLETVKFLVTKMKLADFKPDLKKYKPEDEIEIEVKQVKVVKAVIKPVEVKPVVEEVVKVEPKPIIKPVPKKTADDIKAMIVKVTYGQT